MVQNVNGSTFNQNTRFTKKGNSYQKTNSAKWVGVGIGAGIGLAKNANLILNMKKVAQELETMIGNSNIKTQIQELFQNIAPNDADFLEYLNSEACNKILKKVPKICAGAFVGIKISAMVIVGAIAGGIVNGIINKARAVKADKNNQTQNTQEEVKKESNIPTNITTMLNIKPPF